MHLTINSILENTMHIGKVLAHLLFNFILMTLLQDK